VEKRQSEKAIREICAEEKIKYSSFCNGWLVKLEDRLKKRYIFGYDFEINSCTSHMIAKDKAAASAVLMNAKIPCIEHKIFFNPRFDFKGKDPIIYAKEKYFDVVCKPNEGACGNDVYHARNEKELKKVVKELFKNNRTIAVSPFVKIENEYRAILLDRNVLLMYSKKRKKGEWRHNLAKGASPVMQIDPKIKKKVESLAISAAAKIGIRLCSIDIVLTKDKQLSVLEVNSGIMMDYFSASSIKNYIAAKEVYRKIILTMMK
jgi:glutathione synthase/RimK-type ligase-like ATP-grasp enzyme